MELSEGKIKELLKERKKAPLIDNATRHEEDIRMHLECYTDSSALGRAWGDFSSYIKAILPKDKYEFFLSLVQLPLPTVSFTESICSQLFKVYEAANPVTHFRFTDRAFEEDFREFLKEGEDKKKWISESWAALRTAINSVLIVDLKAEQTTARPEPYYYFLNICNVINYGFDGKKITWIIFKQGKDDNGKELFAVFDDVSYRIFRKESDEIITLLSESEHELGYCPADFFWTTARSERHKDLKKSPFSPEIGKMNRLLFSDVSKFHLDIYAAYPIYWAYAQDCDFKNGETEEYCDGGYLRDPISGKYATYESDRGVRTNSLKECPVCSSKSQLNGPGSYVEIPTPEKGMSPDDDVPDLREPIGVVSVDRDSLDYNTSNLAAQKRELFDSIVGAGSDAVNKSALNEDQVSASFESKENVLLSLKRNLENARQFVLSTMAKLRYGESFDSVLVDMGNEFYIHSPDELQERYNKAKEGGESQTVLDAISTQLIETKYRNNPEKIARMKLLKQIEPYRHFTLNELIQLNGIGAIDPELMRVKVNFSNLIERFERENVPVTEFGSATSEDKKIKNITERLLSYARESGQGSGQNSTQAGKTSETK